MAINRDRDLAAAIRGKKKNPRVGIRYRDQDEGLVMRVGFRVLNDEDRIYIVRWYRSGYFTQEELSKIFGISISIVNKAVRAFAVHAKRARERIQRQHA